MFIIKAGFDFVLKQLLLSTYMVCIRYFNGVIFFSTRPCYVQDTAYTFSLIQPLINNVSSHLTGLPTVTPTALYTLNITCPDGWEKALNNCYLFNLEDKLTWSEARTECSLQNADLMVFRSRDELVSTCVML